MNGTEEYEAYQTARVEGIIPTDQSFEEYLLAEVKRLREQFKLAYDWVDTQFPDGGMADFAKYIGDEEE